MRGPLDFQFIQELYIRDICNSIKFCPFFFFFKIARYTYAKVKFYKRNIQNQHAKGEQKH